MRILHLWQNYCPNLFDRTHNLCIAGGFYSEIVCESLICNETPIVKNIYTNRHLTPKTSIKNNFISRLVTSLLRRHHNRKLCNLFSIRMRITKPDVVHMHFGTTAAILAQYNQLPNSRFIVSFYGVDISQSILDTRILNLYQQVFIRASILHVLCQEASDRLIAVGCPAEKICIANLPIDLQNIPVLNFYPVQATRFLIAARFVEKKGHVILLEAIFRLISEGANVKLTCFGYGPSSWLKTKIRKMGLTKHIDLIDNKLSQNFQNEYIELLQHHDVVVAPSLRARNGDDEGGPALTVIIAQATGRPVIVSDFPGSERSVTDNVEGCVVKMNNIDELNISMRNLIGNIPIWIRYGEAGRTRVMNEFSDSNFWSTLKNWYGLTDSNLV